jgi:hypothetical protein
MSDVEHVFDDIAAGNAALDPPMAMIPLAHYRAMQYDNAALRALLREAAQGCAHCTKIATWETEDDEENLYYQCDDHHHDIADKPWLPQPHPYDLGRRIKEELEKKP